MTAEPVHSVKHLENGLKNESAKGCKVLASLQRSTRSLDVAVCAIGTVEISKVTGYNCLVLAALEG